MTSLIIATLEHMAVGAGKMILGLYIKYYVCDDTWIYEHCWRLEASLFVVSTLFQKFPT